MTQPDYSQVTAEEAAKAITLIGIMWFRGCHGLTEQSRDAKALEILQAQRTAAAKAAAESMRDRAVEAIRESTKLSFWQVNDAIRYVKRLPLIVPVVGGGE